MALLRWTRYPRDLDGAWLAIDELRERIDGMHIADEVAARVDASLRARHKFELSALQKLGAILIAGLTIADLIVQLVRGTGHS